jgi:hypothetical protein
VKPAPSGCVKPMVRWRQPPDDGAPPAKQPLTMKLVPAAQRVPVSVSTVPR